MGLGYANAFADATQGSAQAFPRAGGSATSHMAAIDLTDGTWTAYDPATKLTAAVTRITGTHKHRIQANFGVAGTTVASGIIYYRAIRDADGAYPSNERGVMHRISVNICSRHDRSKRVIVAAGYMNGLPSVGGTVIRFYGLQQFDGTSQLTGRLCTTVTAGTWTTAATNADVARAVHVPLIRASQEGVAQMTPAMDTDGNGSSNDTVRNTYTFSEDRSFGAEATMYEAIYIGCANAGGAVDLYIAGESGFPGPVDGRYHYSPEMGGNQELLRVYVDADSEFIGGASGAGVANYPGVQRAMQELLLRRRSSSRRLRPLEFVGYTGSAMAATAFAHGLDGKIDTGVASGRTLVTAASQAAARAANLNAAGRDLTDRGGQPDVWLIVLGVNDAATRTAAQMQGDIETIAAAVKAEFPLCEVWFAVIKSQEVNYQTLVTNVNTTLPTGVDRIVDWESWWTSAFRVSVSDGHPSLPASPTNLAAFDPPWSMDPAGAAYSQVGVYAFAWHLYKALYGVQPPLISGEVAPE